MADPHPEAPCGGGEGRESAAHPGGGAPDGIAQPGAADRDAQAGAPTGAVAGKGTAAAMGQPLPEARNQAGAARPGALQSETGERARAPAGRKSSPSLALRLRRAHAALAPWVLAPLLLTVSTGLGYRLLRDWGGLGRDQAHGLMVLHEGEWLRHWLGPNGETLYVLANGLGLLWMLGSGAALLWQRWRRPGNRAGGDT